MKYVPYLNVLLPGSGLLLRDRVALGCGMLLTVVCLTAFIIAAPMVMQADFARSAQFYGFLLYVVCALSAGVLWWRLEAATPVSDSLLRDQHALIAKAWLNGREEEARTAAKTLLRKGRHLPEVWALYALVCEGKQSEQAQRRAEELRQRGL